MKETRRSRDRIERESERRKRGREAKGKKRRVQKGERVWREKKQTFQLIFSRYPFTIVLVALYSYFNNLIENTRSKITTLTTSTELPTPPEG